MPAKVSKVKGGYRVATPNAVHAKHTTKAKAEAQKRLLNAIDHGFKPSGTDYDVPMKTAQEYLQEKREEIYAGEGDWDEKQRRIDKEIGDPTTSNTGDLSNRPVGAVIKGTDSIIRMTETEVPVGGVGQMGGNFGQSSQDSAVSVSGTGQAEAAAPYAREKYNVRKG